jgi:hypothetical protein
LGAWVKHNKYLVALLILILAVIILYSFTFWCYDMPFRTAGADSYAHLGMLRSVKSQIGLGENLTPDMFPALYQGNVRNGLNYLIMSLISAIPGSSNFVALYIFGLLGIMLFLAGVYYLTWTLFNSSRAAFLAASLSLLICGIDIMAHGNSFTMVELLKDAHYASIMAMGLAMFALALNIKYLRKASWKLYVGQLLLSLFIFNIHILTGVEYFLILIILVAVYSISERRLSRQHLYLLSIIPATLLIASLWPLYHWWSMFSTGEAPAAAERFSSFSAFIESNILYFIGLPFLIRKSRERVFLLSWSIVFALIALSAVLLPLSASTVWVYGRFANVMRIPLLIGLALGLGIDIPVLYRRNTAAALAVLLVVASVIGVSLWRTGLRYQWIMDQNDYAAVEVFSPQSEDGARLIADSISGYDLMGISMYNVFSISQGHFNGEITQERNEILDEVFLSPDLDTWMELLDEYDTEQVLVPCTEPYEAVRLFLNGKRLERNEFYELYHVDRDDLDIEVFSSTPDPELEQASEYNDYTRFDYWADIQTGGEKDIMVEMIEEAGEGGGTYLRADSEDSYGSLLFVNRGFIEVGPQSRYNIEVDFRVPEGDTEVYFVLFQYDQPLPTHLLREDNLKIHGSSRDWMTRDVRVGPSNWRRVKITFDDSTHFIKIGLVLGHKSASRVEVNKIELSPYKAGK